MSAEILRKAAALMRDRAEAATSGPWEAGEHCIWAPTKSPNRVVVVVSDGQAGDGGVADEDTTSHIASWHPAVALAVADLLEEIAKDYDFLGFQDEAEVSALAVARAYLGADQ